MRRVGGVRARMAAAVVVVLVPLAGCGENAETHAVGSERTDRPLTSAPGKPWTEADLNRVALGDRDGFDVAGRVPLSAGPSTTTAKPATCSPILQALGASSSSYAADARISRIFSSKGSGSGPIMTLSAHSIGDARAVVEAFRRAAEKCTAFRDVDQSYDYEAVEVRPDPGYGDESVSLRLVQVVSYPDGESLKVPYAVVVVRRSTTIAMFYDFNRPRGPHGKKPASVPDDLVTAQVEKIGRLDPAKIL